MLALMRRAAHSVALALILLVPRAGHTVCTPVEQWRWEGLIQAPESPDPCITPLVVQLTDDDGNGRIDVADMPDVLFIHNGSAESGLTAVDGATGAEHFTIRGLDITEAGLAVGDLDGDGLVEIVLHGWTKLLVYEHDGTFKLESDPMPTSIYGNDAISIADIDQDGTPEMFVGARVFNADGSLRFMGTEGIGQEPRYRTIIGSALDLVPSSPGLEVLGGRTAYAPDGSIVWNNTDVPDGFTAVADLDVDGDPEIVLVTNTGFSRDVHVLDHLGSLVGPSYVLESSRRPLSPPILTDMTGDGRPELFIATGDRVEALTWDPTRGFELLWTQPTTDNTGIDGASAFDFDGDGRSEIIYHDEWSWYIFDGPSGAVLSELPFRSATIIETPVIADIDNDCLTEILVSGCLVPGEGPRAVIAYECDAGVRARPAWNQHQYHVTNVDDDGTIPIVERAAWTVVNGWLTQQGTTCGCMASAVADAGPDVAICAGEPMLLNGAASACPSGDLEYRWLEGPTEVCPWSSSPTCVSSPASATVYTLEVRCVGEDCPISDDAMSVRVTPDVRPSDAGNTLLGVKHGPDIDLVWAPLAEASTYALRRGTTKCIWPPLPVLEGLMSPAATLPDVAPPPELYFYRAVGASCSGLEGP